MTDPVAWPTSALPFQSVMFARGPKSISGGQSVSGVEQVVVSPSDRWRARLTTKITSREQANTYRALMAKADGRAGVWLISPCAGRPREDLVTFYTPFSDMALFSDSSHFAATSSNTLTQATVAAAAPIGARSVHVTEAAAAVLEAGLYFSIGQRLYSIASVDPLGGSSFAISFRPGLREAAALGTVLDFSAPVCRMRLASDDSGEMNLETLRFSSISLDFVEAP